MKAYAAFVLVLALVSQGCATGGVRHSAAVGIKTAQTALALADEVEASLVCGQPTAVEGYCISKTKDIELSKKFVLGFKYVREAVDLYNKTPETAPTPAEIGILAQKVAAIVLEILADLPDTKEKAKLESTDQIKAIKKGVQ